jgi:hypothetical protein
MGDPVTMALAGGAAVTSIAGLGLKAGGDIR